MLMEKHEVLIMLVRIENIYQALKFANFIKSINHNIKIIVYGDIVNLIPNFFKKSDCLDAIVVSGDWEISLCSYIKYLQNKNIIPFGTYIKRLNREFPGKYLGNKWLFPNTSKVPNDFYNKLNNKKQISLTIARGCPFNCKYCLSVCTFGIRERRKKVDDVLEFIGNNLKKFDSFKLFAPTFNLDNNWVIDFCNKIIKRKMKFSWCATSRIDLLDNEQLVDLMARAGCYKVSVGLETINKSSKYLNKEFSRDQIRRVSGYFSKNKISLKGLIMLGVPHQTKKDILELMRFMKANGIKIRPTSYSPMDELKEKRNLTIEEIQKYDKFTYYKYGVRGITKNQYYKLMVDPENFESIALSKQNTTFLVY